jgi:hypothetical protein
MDQLYYRDLRRRAKALEAYYLPEPEPVVTICMINAEDGLPMWVCVVGGSFWERQRGEPIPPEILKYARPEARAAYEAQTKIEAANRAPPKTG